MLTAERLREIERDGLAIGEDLTELLKMARRYLWFRAPKTTRTAIMEVSKYGTEKMDALIDQAIAGERE